MSTWIRRLMYGLRRRRHDAELVEEIEAHRALRQAHLEREGVPLPQSKAASQRAMGNVLLAREDARDIWLGGWGTWCDMCSEIRVAARSFLRDPALLVLAVLALALGVAASTAMFSAVHAVVLKPLPFPDQERLFLAWKSELRGGDRVVELSYPEFLDWREQLQPLADVSVLPTTVYGYSYILSGRGEPAEIDSARVGSSFFSVLGIQPAFGRDFAPADDRVGASPVVIVTHEFWEQWLGSDLAAVGSVITLSDVGFTVIGVLPRGASYPAGAELFTLAGTNQRWVSSRRAVFLQLIGRAKPGVSLARVRTHLNATIARLAERYPETRSAGQVAVLRTLPEQIAGSGRRIVWLLFGGSVVLLLLAIVNVASLLATKAAARGGEIAVRLAIGADRRALLRQFLSEALLLSACGGVAGVAGAWVLSDRSPRLLRRRSRA